MPKLPRPEFDADGYPSPRTLRTLTKWPIGNFGGALDFLAAGWSYPERVSRELSAAEVELVHADLGDRFLRVSTGGWSGNEELLAAFRQNIVGWSLTWRLKTSGGLYIFEYPAASSSRADQKQGSRIDDPAFATGTEKQEKSPRQE